MKKTTRALAWIWLVIGYCGVLGAVIKFLTQPKLPNNGPTDAVMAIGAVCLLFGKGASNKITLNLPARLGWWQLLIWSLLMAPGMALALALSRQGSKSSLLWFAFSKETDPTMWRIALLVNIVAYLVTFVVLLVDRPSRWVRLPAQSES